MYWRRSRSRQVAEVFDASYSIPIPAGSIDIGRLEGFVVAREQFAGRYCNQADAPCHGVALESIGFVAGAAPTIGVSQVVNVGDLLEGRQNDGSPVPAGQVPGARYSVDKPEFATVDEHSGEVRGVAAGVVTVTATVTGLPPAMIGVTVQTVPVPVVTSIRSTVRSRSPTAGMARATSRPIPSRPVRPTAARCCRARGRLDRRSERRRLYRSDGRFTSTFARGVAQAAKGKVRAEIVNAGGRRVADVLPVTFEGTGIVEPPPPTTGDPDPDNDGIPNSRDTCDNDFGPANADLAKNGCPVPTVKPPTDPDTDGDGLRDSIDGCDNEPAPESTNGCLPDLVITAFSPPSSVLSTDCVQFSVTIQNVGNGPTPVGRKVGVLFTIDGDLRVWSDSSPLLRLPREEC